MTGDRIRQHLARHGIKQVFVAQKAGINEKRLSALLTGRIRIQIDDLQKISRALNLSPTAFMDTEREDQS